MYITCKNCGKIPRSEICECGQKIHLNEKIFRPYYNPVDMQIEHDFHEIVLLLMTGLHNNPNYIKIGKCTHRHSSDGSTFVDYFEIHLYAYLPQVLDAENQFEDIEIIINYSKIVFFLNRYSMTIRSPHINYDICLHYEPIDISNEEDEEHGFYRCAPSDMGDYFKCQIISNLLPKIDWDTIPCTRESSYY